MRRIWGGEMRKRRVSCVRVSLHLVLFVESLHLVLSLCIWFNKRRPYIKSRIFRGSRSIRRAGSYIERDR